MKRVGLLLISFILIFAVTACDMEMAERPSVTAPVQIGETARPASDDEIDTIFSLIRNQQWPVLMNWLTFDSHRAVSLEQITERHEKIVERLGVLTMDLVNTRKLDRASDQNIQVFEADMVFETRYGRMERPLTLTYLRNVQENRWELDWTPALIFPGLTDDNDLLVETSRGKRGNIYDRNMRPLAAEGVKYTVGAVAGSYNTESNREVADLLGLSVEKIEQTMGQSWIGPGMFVPLITTQNLSTEQMERLPQFGLTVRRSESRHYPAGASLAHLIGYVGEVTNDEIEKSSGYYRVGDIIGKRGLESLFEEQLRPVLGVTVYLSGSTRTVLYERASGDGQDIQLTIDSELQQSLYEHFKDDEGQVVGIHPESGDLLVLMSVPSFDPNLFVGGISSQDYNDLLNNPSTPMVNRFQLPYAPGSTAKILTFMAGYNLGVINDQTIKTITDKQWQPGPAWGGYKVTRLVEYMEPQDPKQAIVVSDNIFFAQVAVESGKEGFLTQWQQGFGVGEDIPTEYPFYRSQVTNDGTFDNEVLLADAAYGQGQFQITAMQLADIFSGVLTGNIMKPRLIKSQEPEVWKTDIASEATRQSLLSAMRASVERTHVNTVDRPYAALAGKSGTAEVAFDQQSGKPGIDSWFIGFDMNNPTIMLGVQIQQIQRRDDGMTAPRRFGEAFDIIYREGATPYQPSP